MKQQILDKYENAVLITALGFVYLWERAEIAIAKLSTEEYILLLVIVALVSSLLVIAVNQIVGVL